MKSKVNVLMTALIAASLMTGCSQGFNGVENAASTSGGGTNDGMMDPRDPVQNVDMKGFIDGGSYDKTQTFDFDRTRGELVVRLPLGMDQTVMIGNGSIPQLPGVSFYTTISPDGNYHLVVSIPVRYVLRGVNTLPSNRLPNGDPLPLMPAGELPSVAFALNPNSPDRKVYLYLGVDAVGLFVESQWLSCNGLPICGSITLPIRNQQKTKVMGYFSIVMGKNGQAGGAFISSIIPPEIARILDEYFL